VQAVQLELEGLGAARVARAQPLPVRARPRQRRRQVPRVHLRAGAPALGARSCGACRACMLATCRWDSRRCPA